MVSIIAAVALNQVIGFKGKIPWKVPAISQRFERVTAGHTLIMGRKTYESCHFPISLSRQRTVFVVTNQLALKAREPKIANISLSCSPESGLRRAIEVTKEGKIFVVGGVSIFQQLLPYTRMMYLAYVWTGCQGDAFFPEYNRDEWFEAERSIAYWYQPEDPRKPPIKFEFVVLQRKNEESLRP